MRAARRRCAPAPQGVSDEKRRGAWRPPGWLIGRDPSADARHFCVGLRAEPRCAGQATLRYSVLVTFCNLRGLSGSKPLARVRW